MMKSVILALTTMLLAVPLTGIAARPSKDLKYTYLELDYVNLDVDAFDDDEGLIEDFDDGDGFGVGASFAFTPTFFGFAGYSETDSDVTFIGDDNFPITSDEEVKRFDIGLGVNLPVMIGTLDTDFVGRAAYVDVDYGDFDFGATDDSDLGDLDDDDSDGWAVDGRFRGQMTDLIEASLGVGYLDIEDADGFSVLGNVLFEITQNWGVNVEANVGDDVATYLLGVRYSFDRF